MKREAEENAESDKLAKEKAEKINEADSTIFNIEKTLKDLDEKISDEHKEEVKKGLEELKEAKNTGEIEKIDPALDNVNSIMQKITQELYSNVSEQTENTDGFTGSDVEFEEVK
jgi:molecular chaperone DnaK